MLFSTEQHFSWEYLINQHYAMGDFFSQKLNTVQKKLLKNTYVNLLVSNI